MIWESSSIVTGGGCVIEALEDRRLLSATTVLASLRPLAYWPAHVRPEPAVHMPAEVGSTIKAAKAAAREAARLAKLAKKAEKEKPTWPTDDSSGPSVQLTPKEKAQIAAASKGEVDLLGTWSGTFIRNQDHATLAGSITFDSQKKDTAYGAFNMSGIAGQTIRSAVTVGKSRAFNAMLLLNGGGQVSIAGAVTQNENSIIGRWSLQTRTGWTTGVFELKRE